MPTDPMPSLDAARASAFAALSLGCVDRPYPHKSDLVIEGEADLRPPAELTPAFAGCFDWHSAVHGHWAMLQVLQRFPDLPEAPRVREALRAHLTPERLQAEVAVFARPGQRTFERPYGWAWLLRLAADLHRWDDPDAPALAAAVQPLATRLASSLADYLERLSVPVRAGTHNNTAYAMSHALDYAEAVHDTIFAMALKARARAFFHDDRACPAAYEPSGEDFLSPCLAEADLMRRVLPQGAFVPWLDAFLPAPGSDAFRSLASPVEVRDPHDPRLGHLIGLSFHRAAAFRGLASALPSSDPRAAAFLALAARHANDGLAQMADSGYGGEHWLATFGLAALVPVEP
jgi:hypothetical protein